MSWSPAAVAERETLPRLSALGLFGISAFWFGSNFHWGALLAIIVPSQVRAMTDDHALWVGRIVGLGSIIALVVPLVIGALSDRCRSRWGRRRPYMLAGIALNFAGLAVLFWSAAAHNVLGYLGGYLLANFGNNMVTGPYSGVIPDVVREDQRGGASGWMSAMAHVGTILGALAAGMLLDRGMDGAAYAAITAVMAISLAVTLWGVRERPLEGPVAPFRFAPFLRGLWINPRKHPDFAWVWITRFLVVMGMFTVQPFIQFYLADHLGVENPERTTGILLAIILAGAAVTGLLGGRVSDRIGRKPVVYVANIVVAITALGFIFADSLEVAFAIGIVYGLAYGAYYSANWALACDVLPSRADAAKDMAVWHVSMVLPQAIAAPLGGWLLSAFERPGGGGYTEQGYTALFALASVQLALGAFLLRNVRGAR
ncbi:MAG TPA: MFS transporter [Chthonomonadales bacterium]|nr:MFS transporter [Chthonomonadales bacterium]